MLLDTALVNSLAADAVKISVVDSVSLSYFDIDGQYSDGEHFTEDFDKLDVTYPLVKPIGEVRIFFNGDSSGLADVAILEVSYLKDGAVVGSSVVQDGDCELKLLKYKVELPRGAKVTLFDDETLEAKFVAWNLPCPSALPSMTFLQVKAANGREAQITPSAGSYTAELYTELGRRYAVFGEIWACSFEQTLWFASLRVQLSDDTWQDFVPTAGEGRTIVTALPQ